MICKKGDCYKKSDDIVGLYLKEEKVNRLNPKRVIHLYITSVDFFRVITFGKNFLLPIL